MITKEKLMSLLVRGRQKCYIKKSSDYNPYKKSVLYDWEFAIEIDGFIFTDAYRGFNPYSGVEYVYSAGNSTPIWSCDYIGYVVPGAEISAERVYGFLKEARGAHLLNCNGELFLDYLYENGALQYKTHFQGDIGALLQVENFYFEDSLIAQQITAGSFKP